MSDANDSSENRNGDAQESRMIEDLVRCPFGPEFFLQQLSAFARDRCPDPEEHLPIVEVHLADGDVIDVCHIIGLASLWIALAVFDDVETAHGPPAMRTELVPYQLVTRITIRSARPEAHHLGFDAGPRPPVWEALDRGRSAEDALRTAARPAAAPSKHRGRKRGE